MRFAIVGNSGSGKSTLARALCARFGLALLELDDIVWEPGQIAVLRERAAIEADLLAFLRLHESWVVEGCYAELIQMVLKGAPTLIFLNPGEQVCIAHCRTRPWEPHKYATPEAQESMLNNLITWVSDYYRRDDEWSLAAHRRVFDGFDGVKRECVSEVNVADFDGNLS